MGSQSLFGEYAHRWPEAGEALGYAMAAPGVGDLCEDVMAEVPEKDIAGGKNKLRNPGLALMLEIA